jgi:hypothetical protein
VDPQTVDQNFARVQSTGQPGYQPQPGYQQPQYQQPGGMMGGGGGGMLQSFLGGGFGRAIVSGPTSASATTSSIRSSRT